MNRWFRFYDCTLDDPKVQRLSDKLYRTWTYILCVASRTGGILPSVEDMAFMMRLSEKETYIRLGELRTAGLIDDDPNVGATPHNWQGRQFHSDVSTDRVKRFRERSSQRSDETPRNVSETQNETPPDTETETDKSSLRSDTSRAKRARPDDVRKSAEFEEFKSLYPKRDGANPWFPAQKKFEGFIRGGVPSAEIIAGAKAYAATMVGREARFVKQAVVWLNQRCWTDYAASAQVPMPGNAPDDPRVDLGGGVQWPSSTIAKSLETYADDPEKWLIPNRARGDFTGIPIDLIPEKLRRRSAPMQPDEQGEAAA